MNKIAILIFEAVRKSQKKLTNCFREQELEFDYVGQCASDLIKEALYANEPCMIARFGSNELNAVLQYIDISLDQSALLLKTLKYISGEIGPFWTSDKMKDKMRTQAGFFPADDENLAKFGEKFISDINQIDILGSWLLDEKRLSEYLSHAARVRLKDLEPYYHQSPWTEALTGKTILVIHPFEKTIKYQYKRRERLFKNSQVLPKFNLKTLKAVQTIAGTNSGYNSWFDAFDWMCDQVSKIDFDIAIIGAGAYGLPVASYVKNMGKKAVHLGGATQLLFGIKGRRWDSNPFFQNLYNENWTRPLEIERPPNYKQVELGCYW